MTGKTLKLKVLCTKLPGIRFCDPYTPDHSIKEPVYLGIQRGKDVIDQVPANRRQVEFHPEFTIAKKSDGSPNFLGPYARGKPEDRFFYLSWGTKHASGKFEMFRRLKIRLGHLGWRRINESIRTGKPIVVKLKLTDQQGGPLCGAPGGENVEW